MTCQTLDSKSSPTGNYMRIHEHRHTGQATHFHLRYTDKVSDGETTG
jgi:hypothetical protein